MRGNWNTSGGDPMGDSVKGQRQHQQQQQQQQQINVEHRSGDLPLHSPATPAWNIADRIVKEELPEDKNDDSGVSPGHYTSNSVSPRSRRSSSTANGSLSPGSATSQDSNAMQYEYSPQRIFKSCVSPLGFNHSHNHGNRSPKSLQSPASYHHSDILQGNRTMQNTDEPLDMVSNSMKQDCEESDATMQCPICPFSTAHRMQFNEHLAGHCTPKQCDTTDYTSTTSPSYTQLSSLSEDGIAGGGGGEGGGGGGGGGATQGSPSQEERSEHEFDDIDEPGLRVPRVNCQGKVKTFKCKQCNFTAVTKLAFWEHSRGHIKAEKLLTCPKCPFVTEYKHHLEYHLRNHFNSKPFKCDKCPYSCVNKSMLNSHLKSHSNVYQYRCAECSYATKYCHSLKLHLRKYAHKPAMVLNPDGSPNPLPIIDIYGTRRGPKQKSAPKISDEQVNGKIFTGNSPAGVSPISIGNITAVQSKSLFNPEHNLMTIQHPQHQQQQQQQQQTGQMNLPFSYTQIFNAVGNIPGGHFFQQYHHENNNLTNCNDVRKQLFDVYGLNNRMSDDKMIIKPDDFCTIEQEAKRISPPITMFGNGNSNSNSNSNSNLKVIHFNESSVMNCGETIDNKETKPVLSGNESIGEERGGEEEGGGGGSPLDLSKPEIPHSYSKTNSPRGGGTSRRKGRAFKLDKLIVATDDSDDESSAIGNEEIISTNDIKQPFEYNFEKNLIHQNNNKDERDELTSGGTSDYNCQYCDIAFGNVVMYTMHMGYHGYKNPYTCNMCGHQCEDKVSFFLHIARDSHS